MPLYVTMGLTYDFGQHGIGVIKVYFEVIIYGATSGSRPTIFFTGL